MPNEQKEVNRSIETWPEFFFYLTKTTFAIAFMFIWLWGIVLAEGAWRKTLAVFFIPYGAYLIVEDIVQPDVLYTELPP